MPPLRWRFTRPSASRPRSVRYFITRRGRPRSDRLHRAILDAFREVRCNRVGTAGVSRA